METVTHIVPIVTAACGIEGGAVRDITGGLNGMDTVTVADTFRCTMVSTGNTFVSAHHVLRDDAGTLVSSGTATHSGGGLYYRDVMVNTAGWYASAFTAVFSTALAVTTHTAASRLRALGTEV